MSDLEQRGTGRQHRIETLMALLPLVSQDGEGDVVLPFMEWIALAGLSEATARDMRAKGLGPRCVKLTDKKLGVTLAEHRRWIKSRMEARA